MTALLPCSSSDPNSQCTWVLLDLVRTSSRPDTTEALLCHLKVTCLREAWCPSQHNRERPDNSYWFDPLSLQIRWHFERLSPSTLDPTWTLCCHSCQEDCCIDYMSCTSLTMPVLMHEQLYSVKTHRFQVLTHFKHTGLWGWNMSGQWYGFPVLLMDLPTFCIAFLHSSDSQLLRKVNFICCTYKVSCTSLSLWIPLFRFTAQSVLTQ